MAPYREGQILGGLPYCATHQSVVCGCYRDGVKAPVLEPFEVGRTYWRPVVRTTWGPLRKPQWVPVIGPQHTDHEIIGFDPQHFHVDYRFLPKRLRDEVSPYVGRDFSSVFSIPISTVTPEWPLPHTHYQLGNALDYLPELPPDVPRTSWCRVKQMRCTTEYPAYPFWLAQRAHNWLAQLYDAYADEQLRPGLVCPHRGAPLEGLTPDDQGCVTCPLHGLRWSLETGRLAVPGPVRVQQEKADALKQKEAHDAVR